MTRYQRSAVGMRHGRDRPEEPTSERRLRTRTPTTRSRESRTSNFLRRWDLTAVLAWRDRGRGATYGGGGAVARIPSTMRSEEAWPAGHHAGASALTTAGFGPVVVAEVVAAKSPGREVQTFLSRIAIRWLLAGLASRPFRRAAQRERRQPLKPSEFARPHWAGSPALRRTGRLCSHAPKGTIRNGDLRIS